MTDKADAAVRLWAMPVDRLDEAFVARWLGVLDDTERARLGRFAMARSRVEYVAAHALTRALLSATTGLPPAVFRFAPGAKGKPVALVDGRRVDVHFNLSHTRGMVAVAASPRLELGLDVEPVDRTVELDIAGRYFFGAESAWLAGLDAAERPEAFLRLWTLKEAYIKATGRGLSQPLDEFWFEVHPPRIRFTPALADDDDAAWRFHQRVLADRFLVAVGWRATADVDPALAVALQDPAALVL